MSKQKAKSNSIEKGTFLGGLIILIALAGYLVYQLVNQKESPPQLEITSRYEPSMSNYSFRVQVENKGTETAEGAQIEFKLFQDGEAAESGILQIKYVPSQSKETGWVVFSRERQTSDSLVVSSVTFVKP